MGHILFRAVREHWPSGIEPASRLRSPTITPDQVEAEIDRVRAGRNAVVDELQRLLQDMPKDAPHELAALLDVHLMLLEDETLTAGVKHWIRDRLYNAEWALTTQFEVIGRQFDEMEDEYLRERKADLEQVVERVLRQRALVNASVLVPLVVRGDELTVLLTQRADHLSDHPGQLRGESRKIDVRTDVFALGVILYELLSGKRPRNLDASSLFSAIKSAERNPMVSLAKIEPKFGGDLDTIVMKALADSPAQRYASVADFASDLERFLDDRPIEARAPSALYIAGKFARRHRA